MRYVFGTVVAVLLIVVGVGFYQNWWTVQTDSTGDESKQTVDVNLTVDKDKARQDLKSAQDKTSESLEKAGEGLADLGAKAKDAVDSLTADSFEGVVTESNATEITVQNGDVTHRFTVTEETEAHDAAGETRPTTAVAPGERVVVTYEESGESKIAERIEPADDADAPEDAAEPSTP